MTAAIPVRDLKFRQSFQNFLLGEVSRTFALTIPLLPAPLSSIVANAYLLCRITDTIEDDAALRYPEKKYFLDRFLSVLEGRTGPGEFTLEIAGRLSETTPESERNLLWNTSAVISQTLSFPLPARDTLTACVRTMARGMRHFQENAGRKFLSSLRELNDYCYYVAGVVGEMMTGLFCGHSASIREKEDKLGELAVSFGQGLQMVNILKDIWKDRKENGSCWLPAEVFRKHGYHLENWSPETLNPAYEKAMLELVAINAFHLQRGLEYVRHIPASESAIRKSCLWTLSMAYLTIRKIRSHPRFTDGAQVKIKRVSVAWMYLLSSLAAKSNLLLDCFFGLLRLGLPKMKNPDVTINRDLGLN